MNIKWTSPISIPTFEKKNSLYLDQLLSAKFFGSSQLSLDIPWFAVVFVHPNSAWEWDFWTINSIFHVIFQWFHYGPLWQCFIYITFQYVFKMIFYVCCFFGLFSLRNSGVSRWPLPLWAVPHQSKRRPRWSTTHRRTPRLPEAQQLRRLLLFFDSKKTQCHMVMAWFLETIVMAWIPPGWLLGIEVEWNLPKLFDGNANLRIKIKLAFRDCSPATWAATAFTNRPLSWP